MAGLARRSVLVLAAGGLAGCGFRPLLGRRDGAPSVQAVLSTIRIDRIGEDRQRRLGQILRNELIDRFSAGRGLQPARYALDITLEQDITALVIQSSNTVTRSSLVVSAVFELSDLASGEVLLRSTASATGSHDIVVSEYASQVARQETAHKAVRDLAGTITEFLSFHLLRRQEPAGS